MLQAFGLELLQAHAWPAIYPFAGSRRPRGPMSKTSSWCSTCFEQARDVAHVRVSLCVVLLAASLVLIFNSAYKK